MERKEEVNEAEFYNKLKLLKDEFAGLREAHRIYCASKCEEERDEVDEKAIRQVKQIECILCRILQAKAEEDLNIADEDEV